jgi:hypothetical protein
VSVDSDEKNVIVQAKLTFKSKLAGNLGETEFAVTLTPDGKLKAAEVDLKLIKANLMTKKMEELMPWLELEGSLSLNFEGKFKSDEKKRRMVFDEVQKKVKSEIQVGFKNIKVLKSVKFKLAGTIVGGEKGEKAFIGAIEFTIPGS